MLSTTCLRFLFIFVSWRIPLTCTQTGPPPHTLPGFAGWCGLWLHPWGKRGSDGWMGVNAALTRVTCLAESKAMALPPPGRPLALHSNLSITRSCAAWGTWRGCWGTVTFCLANICFCDAADATPADSWHKGKDLGKKGCNTALYCLDFISSPQGNRLIRGFGGDWGGLMFCGQ